MRHPIPAELHLIIDREATGENAGRFAAGRVAWQATTQLHVNVIISLSNEGGLERMVFTREKVEEIIQDETFVDWL